MTAASSAFDRWRHELANQLGIILGFSQLLLDELDSADGRRGDLEEIHAAARRAMVAMTRVPPVEESQK
jgi:hypothetical protein